jgi:hypothetical protein
VPFSFTTTEGPCGISATETVSFVKLLVVIVSSPLASVALSSCRASSVSTTADIAAAAA